MLELPLVVMDATLAEDRYLGLSADDGLELAVATLERAARAGGTVSVLWHNDRFDPAYARGWDRAYDRLLAMGARARRPAVHGRRGRRAGRRPYAASVKRTRRRPPRATTVSSASTAAGMNCVPVQRRSSASAPSIDIALR